MSRPISVVGSTGSVGRQALDVARHLGVPVVALAVERNIKLLEEQVREFKPKLAAVYDKDLARDFKTRIADTGTRVMYGIDGLCESAADPDIQTAVIAVSGTDSAIMPTLAAIDTGKRVALANKETLVCAGGMLMGAARAGGTELIPVDSEHSAIFQCIRECGEGNVQSIVLTASGGPFRGMSRDELSKVTPEMALRNPNWKMGPKVTVDSATLMNKGLELIEAMHLFNMRPEQIEVIVHPQSIIHSMVRLTDGAVLAQLASPDMRLPIQYALTYPDRAASQTAELDFAKIGALTFEEPDMEAFPCLRLAIDAAKRGTVACAALCGADEAAVELFLQGKIGFNQIYELVAAAVDSITVTASAGLAEARDAIEAARRLVRSSFSD